ncbi:MAG: M23 family metallopeptidase, partial [Candidatus Binatia bacterium]
NCPDRFVVAYTGEEGRSTYGFSAWKTPSQCDAKKRLYGHPDDYTGWRTPFSVGGQYVEAQWNEFGLFLFYDGHTGYDYPTPNGTAVHAAAGGIAYHYGSRGVRIDHPNGYSTYYLHLSSRRVTNGQPVNKYDIIGTTGDGHLHLTVMKGSQRVDPYGWKGQPNQDPLRVDGGDNRCLWDVCE